MVALRRILSRLVLKKRASGNKSQQASWLLNDLLFISSYGESEERAISFAHFSEDKVFGDLPTLRVLGWDSQDTVLRLEDVEQTLSDKLHWPEDESDVDAWRTSWSSAFTLRPREVIRTSKELAIRLADLATLIRARVNQLLAIESENGPLRKLLKAFQEALIHDLDEDGFADMYAQTIAYGLLTARVSRPAGLIADNIHDLPNTNPFLKEQLEAFLTVGGRKGKIDFDELGVNEVVELLRNANMESVLKDFGDRNPQEDPVIHFYELFLKEYDPEKRMKRGVFYTPRPVVTFIVRSVDQILRNEFGLEDGLADTTTWAEMAKRHEGFTIPKNVRPDEPFVQILDPATGTGTFLVEVIDQIYQTLRAKWTSEKRNAREMDELWNDYVPRHLLPRLHGFELMMAPYAIAHMKIGLKLRETHYRFLSSERARIYLTNTLEEPKEFSSYFEQMAPALAHEAHEANKIKRNAPITVVIGNPPYSIQSQNLSQKARAWVDVYRYLDGKPIIEKGALQFEKNLQNDYVKFIAYGQQCLNQTQNGILGFITDHGYLSNPTFRGMRGNLMSGFNAIYVLDLHGSSKERGPKANEDENVFEIQQGVALGTFIKAPGKPHLDRLISHAEMWGPRSQDDAKTTAVGKYQRLLAANFESAGWNPIAPTSPSYLFVPQDSDLLSEYSKGWALSEVFLQSSAGVITARDNVVVDFTINSIVSRVELFMDENISNRDICERLEMSEKKGWKIDRARDALRAESDLTPFFKTIYYRPFDTRHIFYHPSLVWSMAFPTMRHMLSGANIALAWTRPMRPDFEFSIICTRSLLDQCAVGNKAAGAGVSHLAPLYLYPVDKEKMDLFTVDRASTDAVSSNFSSAFIEAVRNCLNAPPGLPAFSLEDLFHYVYAILHSPKYRNRYSALLKIEIARVPLTSDTGLFRKLCALGAVLVGLHLFEDDYEASALKTSLTNGDGLDKALHSRFLGNGVAEVAKGYPNYREGNVYINPSRYFEGVPEEVWTSQVGGYQVCEKWLKDRRIDKYTRALTDEDINHYQRIVVALNETTRLRVEIDRVIDEHGGWPLVGSQDTPKPEAATGLPFA